MSPAHLAKSRPGSDCAKSSHDDRIDTERNAGARRSHSARKGPHVVEYARKRRHMVSRQLRGRGITDGRVLDAMDRVPREWFVRPEERDQAYDDRALPIGCQQTISQPYIVSLMSQELMLRGTERVLEIGTGSGYQTAILAELAAEVYTVERVRELSLRARMALDARGYQNVHYHIGDGTLGWPEHASYDRIVVTAMAPEVPASLFDQLGEGGVMVIPVGSPKSQMLQAVHKENGEQRVRDLCPCLFVRLVGQEGWPDGEEDPNELH